MAQQRTVDQLNAELYDLSTPDWRGEIDFYRDYAKATKARGQALLDVGCGTGRVAIRLAPDSTKILGVDLNPAMLEQAQRKSGNVANVRWMQGDMRALDLGETFGLILVAGHSFQSLLTVKEQVACLDSLKRHLAPGGTIIIHIDHQDVSWLGDVRRFLGGTFGEGQDFKNQQTHHAFRRENSWTYDPVTQTSAVITRWTEQDAEGRIVQKWETKALQIHCVFRFEMEHLLARAGLHVEGLYGDFFKNELASDSTEMIWVLKR